MEKNILEVLAPTLGPTAEVRLPANVGDYPVVITAAADFDCLAWAHTYKNEVNELLLVYGAVLLRGFNIGSADMFNRMFSELAGEAMEYKNRTSPREQVHNNVYTSTSHPSDQVIHMHTENSYSTVYNRIIAFYCLVPPDEGGETPIADERRLLQYIDAATLRKFREKKIQYVRNTIEGVGLTWKTIYQTEDKAVVNRILEEQGMAYEWITDDQLRVKWVLPAFQVHPVTGEEVWFNHMYFGHKSLYDPVVLEFFDEANLPFSTYYGDGSEIEEETIQQFKDFYQENSIVFSWEKDDFLLLDNMMFSHGRRPYQGKRTILTAMAQPITSR